MKYEMSKHKALLAGLGGCAKRKQFLLQFRPPKSPKSLKLYWNYNTFWLFGVFKIRSISDPIWVRLGSTILPTIQQNLIKNRT